jgi:phospholipid/cholesterol/gamma-HCH transport system ATP-binding protein
VATNVLEYADPLAEAMAKHLHEHVIELGGFADAAGLEQTRLSCWVNIWEILVMLRAGIPATAHETPADALDYARFLQRRGVGFTSVVRAYQLGVAMLGPVLVAELTRAADPTAVAQLTADVQGFVWRYIDRVMERLSEEFATERDWRSGPEDPGWQDQASIEAARRFLEQLSPPPRPPQRGVTVARARAERSVEQFRRRLDGASGDADLTRRLALADTTIRIILADEPDLAFTVQLDPSAVRTGDGTAPAESEMVLASIDVDRLFSRGFNLAMAIARGRVRVDGPVRKFLRVVPIVRELPLPVDHDSLHAGANGYAAVSAEEDQDDGGRFDPATEAVLDKAAEYELHQGAMAYREEKPGYYWSIECSNVHKAFGSNVVLNGLTVGVPEGMITVILGPSGTGKSVLISHLIGLMFPDIGEVRVHGQNVAELRLSELLLLRRKFGILFQDGALFGSMNVYDNVAFPLRQHTNKSEDEIAAVVNQRLAEVGLERAWYRTPGELSGGMKKRAGFARALVLEPEIVMFDEPDSGLDPVRTALLCELIERMHAEHGGTYIVITHNIAAARQIAEYIVVLWKGRIVQSGDKDDMLTSPNPFVRQFLAGRSRGPLGMD